MYRRGHQGLVLLVLAPIEYLFLSHGQPFLAFLVLFGVVVIEPLPDTDQKVPWLRHRGTSHSLCSAILIGLVLAGVGWMAGQHVLGGLSQVAADLSRLTAEPLHMSVFSDGPTWLRSGFAGLSGTLDWIATRLGGFDNRTLAVLGFAIGAGGIVIHLLGDVITISGIQPLLPVSKRHISVSCLRADSTGANLGLFVLGIVSTFLVLSVAVPGVGLAAGPAELSPIGVVGGQHHPQTPNQTQTTNHTQNPPAVDFANQSVNDSTVVIKQVSLPDGGFVVVHNALFLPPDNQSIQSAVGLSPYLSPGTHHDVRVTLLSGTVNRSTGPQLLVAVPSRDTNGNQSYDYVHSGGKQDTPYRNHSNETVLDQATVHPGPTTGRSESNASTSATLRFQNQVANRTHSQVTVRSVTLPNGGFVVIHGSAYLDGVNPDPLGVSQYLPPGQHTNVTIPLSQGIPGAGASQNRSSLGKRQRLAVVAYNDTNGNHHYDHYTASNNSIDAPYTNATGRPVLASGIVVSRSAGAGSNAPQITFSNQPSNGRTITISSVTLSQPGFVAVSNASTPTSSPPPAGSVIGVSKRLNAGTHHNVTIRLYDVPGLNTTRHRLRSSQSLVVVPTVDTGKTGRYQYVVSGGTADVPVVSPNGSPVASQAFVRVRNASQSRSQSSSTQSTKTTAASASATAAASSERGRAAQPISPATTTAQAVNAAATPSWWWYGIYALIGGLVAIVTLLLWRRWR